MAVVAVALLVRRRLAEVALLVGVALIRSLNAALKWLVDSPRPFTTDHRTNDVASGLGYPSGHAMGTMLIGGALTIVVFRLTRSPGPRAAAIAVATAAILATGFGRIVTRAHWPSDVAGGWLWGFGLLGVVVLLVAWTDRRWRPGRTTPPPVQAGRPAGLRRGRPVSGPDGRRSR